MAAKFRRVDPRIWDDERFDDFTNDQAVAAFWLITSRAVNRIGIAVFTLGECAEKIRAASPEAAWQTLGEVTFALKWPLQRVSRTTCVCVMPSFFKYNPPANRDHLTGVMRDLADVPNSEAVIISHARIKSHIPAALVPTFEKMWCEFYGVEPIDTDTVFNTVFPTVPPRPKKPPRDQEQVQQQKLTLTLKQKTKPKKQTQAAQIDEVLEHYKKLHTGSKPGKKERSLIRARIKDGYDAAALIAAVDGCHASPFHLGENGTGTKHLGIAVIFKSSDQVNKFIELAKNPPHQNNGHGHRQTFEPTRTATSETDKTFGRM